jgi:hypothetical protein
MLCIVRVARKRVCHGGDITRYVLKVIAVVALLHGDQVVGFCTHIDGKCEVAPGENPYITTQGRRIKLAAALLRLADSNQLKRLEKGPWDAYA